MITKTSLVSAFAFLSLAQAQDEGSCVATYQWDGRLQREVGCHSVKCVWIHSTDIDSCLADVTAVMAKAGETPFWVTFSPEICENPSPCFGCIPDRSGKGASLLSRKEDPSLGINDYNRFNCKHPLYRGGCRNREQVCIREPQGNPDARVLESEIEGIEVDY